MFQNMFDQMTSKKKPDIGGGGDVPTLQEVTTAAEKKGIRAMTWKSFCDPFARKFDLFLELLLVKTLLPGIHCDCSL